MVTRAHGRRTGWSIPAPNPMSAEHREYRRLPTQEEIERCARAFELWAGKVTYDQIAEKMGCSKSSAHRLVTRGMRFYLRDHGAEETKTEILGRINLLIDTLMPKALAGDEGAIDRVLKLDKRLADLLGLDPPRQVRVGWVPDEVMDSAIQEREHTLRLLQGEGRQAG